MKLKIQYASDLHLEFPANREYLLENPLEPVGEILVLAGDIIPFTQQALHEHFFDFLSKNFKTTYWIPGNHEYYHYDINWNSGSFMKPIRENVFLVNNIAVQHENVKLIFSTLWSKISKKYQHYVENGMPDFYLISNNDSRFTAKHYNQLHEESVGFIKNEVAITKKDSKIAVFTHHCPTFINYPEEYRGSKINEGFATELSEFIENSNINYWCYGHHHRNIPEFTIGKTKMICNQLGYVQREEHYLFDTKKHIELLR